MLTYNASPTGAVFMACREFIKIIMGPVGGGKSTVALMDLVDRAIEQEPFDNVRRTKFVILRNTVAQLKSTVKPMMDTWLVTMTKGSMGQWRLSDNTFEARFRLPDGTIVHSEFLLMAADTPDDVRRLLSLECSAAWVEEAREVDPEVFAGLQGRVNRFPSRVAGGVTRPGVICSTNPPPVGGFWHDLITVPQKGVGVFIQPPALLEDGSLNPEAENLANLAPDYYENLISGKTEEWINVYLKNQFGAGDLGRPIYQSSFKKSFHVAKAPLKAIMQSIHPLVIGMDNGLQAAAVIGQMDARGRVNLLGQAYVPEDTTMGVEAFLDRILIPELRTKFSGFRSENIVFCVDPACFARSQVDEKTIAQAIMDRGYQVAKASTNDPERRISAVEQLLLMQNDGAAGLLIDPSLDHVINTLEWGHRYKKSPSGLTSTTADKTHHSHCFVAGTLVSTTVGDVPIEKVTCDHEVLTPQGVRPVIATMCHTSRDLVELEFSDGTTLVCTADHPFFTERGIVDANALDYNEVLFRLGEKQCLDRNTPFRNTSGSSTTASRAVISSPTTPSTAESTCTGPSGRRSTGLFRTATTYTTSTATRLITALKTWSACRAATTFAGTCSTATPHQKASPAHAQPCKKRLPQPQTGMGQSKAEPGTQSTANALGRGVSALSCAAHTARSHTSGLLKWLNEGFARLRARAGREGHPASTTRQELAPSAAASSGPTSTERPEHAVRLVGKRPLFGQSAKVYDLTVDVEHCFYANGVRVANCGDAIQYLCLHYRPVGDGKLYGQKRKARKIVPSTYHYT